jgi:RNA polymerase sigma-70 factor (ECF subfamily)
MNTESTSSDQALFARLKTGDVNAFEMIFKQYYNPLCSYAYTLLGDRDEAADTVQRTMTTLWEKSPELDLQYGKSYLYTAVRNSALNVIKHRKVQARHINELRPENFQTEIQESEQPLQNKINTALEKLPTQCRAVFELSRYEELRYAEIAERLGISVKTVENQISKALRIMRVELKDYLPAWIVLHLISQL